MIAGLILFSGYSMGFWFCDRVREYPSCALAAMQLFKMIPRLVVFVFAALSPTLLMMFPIPFTKAKRDDKPQATST
jgi:hypothetical protein